MKTFKKQPITGAKPTSAKRSPQLMNQTDTSRQAEKLVSAPSSPFRNNKQTPQIPAGSAQKGAVPGPVRKPTSGLRGNTVGAKALPSGSPVGYKTLPNQSGQVFGRMGTSHPKKKGAFVSVPKKGNASFYGE